MSDGAPVHYSLAFFVAMSKPVVSHSCLVLLKFARAVHVLMQLLLQRQHPENPVHKFAGSLMHTVLYVSFKLKNYYAHKQCSHSGVHESCLDLVLHCLICHCEIPIAFRDCRSLQTHLCMWVAEITSCPDGHLQLKCQDVVCQEPGGTTLGSLPRKGTCWPPQHGCPPCRHPPHACTDSDIIARPGQALGCSTQWHHISQKHTVKDVCTAHKR